MIPKLISRTCHETILWYHVKQNGSKTGAGWVLLDKYLWYHVKQNGSKTLLKGQNVFLTLWYHVKQNGSKTLHENLTALSNPLVPCQTEWFQNLVSSIQHDWS